MSRLGPASSPVVARTLQRKQRVERARLSLVWGGVNLGLAVLLATELFCGPMFGLLDVFQPALWYLEAALACLFTVNVLWDALVYLGSVFSLSIVELNPLQRKLMGVRDYEPGFRDPKKHRSPKPTARSFPTPTGPSPPAGVPAYSPSAFTSSRGAYHGMSSPVTPPHLTASPFSHSFSPSSSLVYNNYTMISPLGPTPSPPQGRPGLRTPSPSPSGSSPGGSFICGGGGGAMIDGSPVGYGGPGLNASRSFTGASPLSVTNTLSPLFKEAGPDTSGLRARFNTSSTKASPMRADEMISDQKALNQFLAEQQDKELRRQAASPDASPGNNSSFWSYNRSLTDYTPILKRYQYQVACRSPQQTKAKDDDANEPASYQAEEVWSIHNVRLNRVDKWIENLRKWLSDTILTTLLIEIDKINNTLARIGCEDTQIGEVGISTLKQIATTKSQHVPTLNAILPFLEVCANQEYLVSRIRELGSTGCMSSYKWNGGGAHKSKPWGEHLPTDALLLTHMLCSYLDARLPAHPKYPDGRTFTTQHLLRTPDKPDAAKKDHLLLYQSKINPPHFKVMLEDDVLNPPAGRNNLFHTILLFLHHIKNKQHGMLGRINLGLSGINILWVLEE